MTTEEAIKALRLMEHVESISTVYEPGEARNDTTVRGLKEACRMAITALRAQTDFNGIQAERDTLKNAKLDRSLWKGCDICKTKGYLCGTIHIMPSLYSTQRTLFLFCPDCSRPLTEEAWVELERRINGGKAD